MVPLQSEFDAGDELSKPHFDRLCPEDFKEGPFVESQGRCGGNYKEVLYIPNRRAWGWLKDGRMVWAWVRGEKARNG